VPAPHCVHAVTEPVAGAYVPAGQATQLGAAAELAYAPELHDMHDVEPELSVLVVPAGHAAQLVAPVVLL
jgi:hypothetical protein